MEPVLVKRPILVKRYTATRLYDTSRARYVSLDQLHEWREQGIPFEIRDAASSEDVTQRLLPVH